MENKQDITSRKPMKYLNKQLPYLRYSRTLNIGPSAVASWSLGEGGYEPGLCFSPPPAPCCVWLGGP